jgi:predicted AAA+ superfamily ATPase
VSKSEIDFVVEESYGLYSLIEVKYRNKVKEPLAFRNFEKTYKVDKKIIITKDMFKKEDNIYYIPACIYSFL